MELEKVCRGSGDGYHVIMIFDSINHIQKVRISQFKIDVLRKLFQLLLLSPTRFPEFLMYSFNS